MKTLNRWSEIMTVVVILSLCLSTSAIGQGGGRGPLPPAAELKKMADMPTPRTGDGHPDLTGYWGPPSPPPGEPPSGDNYGVTEVSLDGKTTVLGNLNPHQIDQGLGSTGQEQRRSRTPEEERAMGMRPTYKPEYQRQVDALVTRDVAFSDPTYHCQPYGVPRVGAPWEIVQNPKTIYFIYGDTHEGLRVRVIPIDGRGHDEEIDARPMGDSIGRWDGDTLIVDVAKLADDTWLDRNGTIHSDKLHVIERLTRKGNTIQYEVLVEDPVMFDRLWKKPPETLILSTDKHPLEGYPCVDHGAEHHNFNADSQGFELDSSALKNLPPVTPRAGGPND
jgi:hypothetical protein